MEYTEILQEAGLSEREAELYLTSLRVGPASLLNLSRTTGIHRPMLYKLLGRLLDRGIFTMPVHGQRKLYQAVDPQFLLEYMKRKEAMLESIMPGLAAMASSHPQKPNVRLFEGRKAVKEVLMRCNLCESKEMYCFFPNRYLLNLLGKREFEELSYDRIRRQVHLKTIRSVLAGEDIEGFGDQQKGLREIRTTETPLLESGMGMVLYDSNVILFSPLTEQYALQIESLPFANLMRYFFEQAWATARPS